MVSSGEDASDVQGVSLTHTRPSPRPWPCRSLEREKKFSDVSLLGGTWREDLIMLVISFSVRMLNGIQRTTSALRPATLFHLEVIDCALLPLRDSCPLQGQALVEPAGTCSVSVPASRIPTRCVGIDSFCDDSGVLIAVHVTESSVLKFCNVPFGMLVIRFDLCCRTPSTSCRALILCALNEDGQLLALPLQQHASLG